jgi:hypothetical protein
MAFRSAPRRLFKCGVEQPCGGRIEAGAKDRGADLAGRVFGSGRRKRIEIFPLGPGDGVMAGRETALCEVEKFLAASKVLRGMDRADARQQFLARRRADPWSTKGSLRCGDGAGTDAI